MLSLFGAGSGAVLSLFVAGLLGSGAEFMVSCAGVDIVELEWQEKVRFSDWRFAGCAAVFVVRIRPLLFAHRSLSSTKVGFLRTYGVAAPMVSPRG